MAKKKVAKKKAAPKRTTKTKKSSVKKGPPPTAANLFQNAMGALKGTKAWEESRQRKGRSGGGFSNENVPEDEYLARVLAAKCAVYRNRKWEDEEGNEYPLMYVKITYSILCGPCKGEQVTSTDDLNPVKVIHEGNTGLDFAVDRLVTLGIDMSEASEEEIPEAVKYLISKDNENRCPAVMIQVKNNHTTRTNRKTGELESVLYQNVYAQYVVSEDEAQDLIAQYGDD